MKRVGKPVFFIVFILIALLTYTAFFGVYGSNGDLSTTIIRGAKDIRWGTDIQGGVNVTLGPKSNEDGSEIKASGSDMEKAATVVELRLVNNNITDYELYTDAASNRIIVSFPWKDGENQDADETINELAASANLLFIEGLPTGEIDIQYDENGQPTVTDSSGQECVVVMTGKDVSEASVNINSETNEYIVSLDLNDSGSEKFAEATGRLVGQQISIWLDDYCFSAPNVNEQITGGQAMITGGASGGFTAASANDLADKINAGALPIPLEAKERNIVSPTLGKGSLNVMVLAGALAFALVCILMILKYRLPGFVACIALLGQVAGSIAAVSGYFGFINSFTLTLPGIAGIILSIGMGVDANIITAERIREEINVGKTIDGALDSGNDNSISSIVDGNVTVIIVAIILMTIFGPPSKLTSFLFGPSTTGEIYSFGYTLLVGCIFNFIMGVYASRSMLKSLSRFKIFRKKWLYGGAKEQ